MAWIVDALDDNFIAHMDQLAFIASAAADAVIGTSAYAQRYWYNPPLAGSWLGDPLDVVGLNDAFDRTALNAAYVEVVSSTTQTGRQGEAMLLKIQLDYIAALERAYRTRQTTSVRARIHAAGRRAGHGADGGLFNSSNGNVATWLLRILEAAHDGPVEE